MKKITLILAALAVLAGVRAAEPKSSYTITTDFTYTSKYVFRGIQNARSSVQPSVEFVAGEFNMGVWTNQPLRSRDHDEVNVYAGYTYSVNSALKLEGVATYYWYPEAKASLGQTKRSYEAGMGVTYSAGGFSPSLYYYHDFRLHSDTLQAAVGYSLPIGNNWSVDTTMFGATVTARNAAPDATGLSVQDSYSFYGLDLSVPYRLSDHATVTIGIHYADTHGLTAAKGNLGDNNLWYTAGVTIGF